MMSKVCLLGMGLFCIACGPTGRDGSGSGNGTPVMPDGSMPPPPDVIAGDAAECAACDVTGPGMFCGVQVGITPYVTGGTFGGFQSAPGTGASSLITITLAPAINWVSVKVLDPDYDGNVVRAYDINNTLVSEYVVMGDGVSQVLTEEEGGTGGTGIVRVDLVPAPADYVAYDALQIVPAGCGPIVL